MPNNSGLRQKNQYDKNPEELILILCCIIDAWRASSIVGKSNATLPQISSHLITSQLETAFEYI